MNLQISDKQKEILTYVSEGRTSKEIAGLVLLSDRTIHNNLTNLRKKFNAKNTIHLITIMRQNNII